MHEVDDYITSLPPAERAAFERIASLVRAMVPTVEQGRSYGMAAFMYRGWPVLSLAVTKKFLSLYPFSGKVLDTLQDKLQGFECTTGSVHFSVEKPLPEILVREIISARLQEIEQKKPRIVR